MGLAAGPAGLIIFGAWVFGCVGMGYIAVRSKQRVSFEQKFPRATFATLIAISTFATHTWRITVGPLPNCKKSTSMK